MCVDTPVHVAEMSLYAVKLVTSSAVQGEPQRVASVDASACQLAIPVVVVAATGGTGGITSCPAHRGDVAGSVAGIFDIESILDIENALDLEGKNSDIYHVINCISHFFWIVYIVC